MISETIERKQAYIEELGIAFEGFGVPRMAGRILGALLVADPPEQTAEDLAETLQASRGSISTNTRTLEQYGLIERFSKPGERRDYFRNKPDAWLERTHNAAKAITYFKDLATKGLTLLDTDDPEVRRGLEDMHDYFAFMEMELPRMLADWKQARLEKAAQKQKGDS